MGRWLPNLFIFVPKFNNSRRQRVIFNTTTPRLYCTGVWLPSTTFATATKNENTLLYPHSFPSHTLLRPADVVVTLSTSPTNPCNWFWVVDGAARILDCTATCSSTRWGAIIPPPKKRQHSGKHIGRMKQSRFIVCFIVLFVFTELLC